jgi:hypothetical protein
MSLGMLRLVVSKKLTDISEVIIADIINALMMEAVSTSETSVSFYETARSNIPEEGRLHTRLREDLESHSQSNNTA